MGHGTQIEPQIRCRLCGHTEIGLPPGQRCPHDDSPMIRADVLARYPRDQLLGRVLGDKYTLIDVLGTGGFGAVYLALQAPLDRPVAVKMIRREASMGDTSLSERFFQEAKTIARLEHECIVTLYDYGESPVDGLLYMVMERVKGHTLKAEMARAVTLEPQRVVQLSLNILGALAAAHKIGVVHRDLKPDNVMISEGTLGEERVRVLDFGIAKLLEGYGEEQRQMTQHGLVLGTPRYMAPEVATRRGARPQSDLYALGVMIYEMLTGRPPFTGRSGFEIMQAHVRQPLPDLQQQREIPHWMKPILAKVLAKAPEDRYPDARALAVALKTAVPQSRDMPSLSLIPALTSSGVISSPMVPSLDPAELADEDLDETEPPQAPRPQAVPVTGAVRRTRVDGMAQVPVPVEALDEIYPVRQPSTIDQEAPSVPLPVAMVVDADDASTTSRELMGESAPLPLPEMQTETASGAEQAAPRPWVRWAIFGGVAAGLLVGSLLTMNHLNIAQTSRDAAVSGTSGRRAAGRSGNMPGGTLDAGVTPHRVVLGALPGADDGGIEELVTYDAVLPDDAEASDGGVGAAAPARDAGRSDPPRRRRRRRIKRDPTPGPEPKTDNFRIERL
ncbi:MAG: serine/threonine protein kinase [Bradymonadia bacterium]